MSQRTKQEMFPLVVNKWHHSIGESTIADAIFDRLVHAAHRIELTLKGESMRKKALKKT